MKKLTRTIEARDTRDQFYFVVLDKIMSVKALSADTCEVALVNMEHLVLRLPAQVVAEAIEG